MPKQEKSSWKLDAEMKVNPVSFSSFLHYEAKLCILRAVSGFRNKDAPCILLLFFHCVRSFRQNFNMFKDLSLESRITQKPKLCPYPVDSLAS